MNLSKKLLTVLLGISLFTTTTTHSMTIQTLYSVVAGYGIAGITFFPARFFISDKPCSQSEKSFIGASMMIGLAGLGIKCMYGVSAKDMFGNSPATGLITFLIVGAFAVCNAGS